MARDQFTGLTNLSKEICLEIMRGAWSARMLAALPSGVHFSFYILPRGALASSLPLGYNTDTPFGGEHKAIFLE